MHRESESDKHKRKLKRRKKTILTVIVASLFAVAPAKKIFEDLAYNLRVGYSIGGTAPLDMPASIRKLNKYTLT